MATGLYWCLVLIECLSLVVHASYIQTSPSYSGAVCPGDKLVLTCVFSGNQVFWIGPGTDGTGTVLYNNTLRVIGSFNISVIINESKGVLTATNESVPLSLDGAVTKCGASLPLDMYTIHIADPPLAVENVTITAITHNSGFISWSKQDQQYCVVNYIITIISNNTFNKNMSSISTNITIPDLIIGSNYSFTIIPIDTVGREGPPSSSIQYIWNVPVQVVNVSWYQISYDSIIIWWNNTEDLRPPTNFHIIELNTANCISNCTVTYNETNTNNINISKLSATIEYYTAIITPHNVVGNGPPVSINVSVTTTLRSSSSVINTYSTDTKIISQSVFTSASYTLTLTLTTTVTATATKETSFTSSVMISDSSSTRTHSITSLVSSTTPPPPTTATGTATATVTGSGAVPVIAGAIGGIVLLIIIIIIIVIGILVYTRRHSGTKEKDSHTANGSRGEKSAAVSGESWRKNNFELSPPAGPTDPTYATPTTEYTPAPVRHIQGGDGPPLYPPPPPGGQYSVLRGDDDDDDIPPPVPPAYNPDGVQEYSVLKREGEKKSQQPLPQGATPLYSTLNQTADTPPPVPAYNPDGVQNTQDYSVLKREGENKSQQALPVSLYSTINKDQGQVDESAHKLVYADLSIASKDKRPQPPPTNEQAVLYASVNNQVQSKAPPPVPPPQDKVLYADLSVTGKRTPRTKPRTQPAEDRVLYAAVNGNGINRKSTTQELLMAQIGDLDIPPPIPPKPKP